MTNPLLSDWDTPFDLPPFTLISDADFAPAVDAALDAAKANINDAKEITIRRYQLCQRARACEQITTEQCPHKSTEICLGRGPVRACP